MKLSPNFTLEELCATSYPDLQKQPSVEQVINLVWLCAAVLQPLRDLYGQPITISSGFRSIALNKKVGGVDDSYHLKGHAADIKIASEKEAYALFCLLRTIKAVDLCLFERKNGAIWLHVQTTKGTPRRRFVWNYKA